MSQPLCDTDCKVALPNQRPDSASINFLRPAETGFEPRTLKLKDEPASEYKRGLPHLVYDTNALILCDTEETPIARRLFFTCQR